MITLFLLPFIVSIFVSLIAKKKVYTSILLFSAISVMLNLLFAFVWGLLVSGTLYHEWDPVFVPYGFLGHEESILDGTGGNFVIGSIWFLTAVWLLMICITYFIS